MCTQHYVSLVSWIRPSRIAAIATSTKEAVALARTARSLGLLPGASAKDVLIEQLLDKAFPRPAVVSRRGLPATASYQALKQNQAVYQRYNQERSLLRSHLNAHLEPLPAAKRRRSESEELEEEQPLPSEGTSELRDHPGCPRPCTAVAP